MTKPCTLFLTSLLLLCSNAILGQMVNDCVFLKGRYVEIGIAPNGGYGSTITAPAGYHPNNPSTGYASLYDPMTTLSSASGGLLGFVADYGRDGWTTGAPPFFGDMYMPGFPQEGWAIQVAGVESDAYIPSYITTGATGYTGTLAGTNSSYTNTGTGVSKGLWQGGASGLAIRQTTTLDTTKLYFTVNVILTNTTTATLNNIYYLRTLDPDNDIANGGSFTTVNKIAYQNDAQHRVLVSTTGTVYSNDYLGLGTKDCRAKCMIFNKGSLAPQYTLDQMWSETTTPYPYFYTLGQVDTQDVGIALIYNIGSIAAGDSTSLTYAYILNAAYIDTALDATRPTYTVNDTNSYSSSATINLCSYPGDSVKLKITGGEFYNWKWAPGDTAISDTLGTLTYVRSYMITSTTIYTVTGVNKSGSCDSIFYYLALKHDTFMVPGVKPASYCVGDVAVPLTNPTLPAGGVNLWWTSLYGGVGSPTPPTPSTAFAGTTVYYVSQTYTMCASVRTPDTVTVRPIPLPPVLFDPNPYCQGAPFVTPTATGTLVNWYTTATGGVGSAFPPTINTNIPGQDTLWATQTVNGCTSLRAFLPITILDSIRIGFDFVKGYGCGADTVRINNYTTGALKYTWDFGDGLSDTVTNPTHIYPAQGGYTVTLTATNFVCEDTAVRGFFFIHPLSSWFRIIPDVACQNTPVKFADSSVGVSRSHKWDFGDGGTAFNTSPLHTYANSGVYKVRHIVTDFRPCSDTQTAVIQVDSISAISMSISDTTVCQGTYATLTAGYSEIGNTGLVWQFGDGTDSTKNVNPVIHAFNAVNVLTVTATTHYRACRDTSISRKVVVFPVPSIDIGNDTSICAGSEAIGLVDHVNTGNPKAAWRWNTGETSSSITIVAPGKYYASVGINGCTSSDTVWVKNDCYLDIPNVFTPNGDGLNDYFFPREFLTSGLTSFKMEIYNRWGQLVFSTTALDGAGWDGKLNNVLQPEGVFVYTIEANFRDGQKEHRQGNVTLLR